MIDQVHQIAGDGMTIFFNDPVPISNSQERAVRMAVEMRHRVSLLLERWRRLGYELDLGVGIAQDYATIDAIGFEGALGLRRHRHRDEPAAGCAAKPGRARS